MSFACVFSLFVFSFSVMYFPVCFLFWLLFVVVVFCCFTFCKRAPELSPAHTIHIRVCACVCVLVALCIYVYKMREKSRSMCSVAQQLNSVAWIKKKCIDLLSLFGLSLFICVFSRLFQAKGAKRVKERERKRRKWEKKRKELFKTTHHFV